MPTQAEITAQAEVTSDFHVAQGVCQYTPGTPGLDYILQAIELLVACPEDQRAHLSDLVRDYVAHLESEGVLTYTEEEADFFRAEMHRLMGEKCQ